MLHLIKLCVGCDTVEELLAWRHLAFGADDPWILRTRQTPTRTTELIDGGSLYRVYKGFILARQRILNIGTIGTGPASRCEIELEEVVVLTIPTPRRAFQGWRYLKAEDAPADLNPSGEAQTVPAELAVRLRELGAW